MFSLQNIKAVAYDFDETLCCNAQRTCTPDIIHRDVAILCGEDPWHDCLVPWFMCTFVHAVHTTEAMQRDCGIPAALVSAVFTSIETQGKSSWVKKNYDLHMLDLCVGLAEDHRVVAARKLSSLRTLCEHLDLEPENVLLVDDYWGTLVEAGKAGFVAATPIEVACWVDRYVGFK